VRRLFVQSASPEKLKTIRTKKQSSQFQMPVSHHQTLEAEYNQEEEPLQIVDFSCSGPFEAAVAVLERFIRDAAQEMRSTAPSPPLGNSGPRDYDCPPGAAVPFRSMRLVVDGRCISGLPVLPTAPVAAHAQLTAATAGCFFRAHWVDFTSGSSYDADDVFRSSSEAQPQHRPVPATLGDLSRRILSTHAVVGRFGLKRFLLIAPATPHVATSARTAATLRSIGSLALRQVGAADAPCIVQIGPASDGTFAASDLHTTAASPHSSVDFSLQTFTVDCRDRANVDVTYLDGLRAVFGEHVGVSATVAPCTISDLVPTSVFAAPPAAAGSGADQPSADHSSTQFGYVSRAYRRDADGIRWSRTTVRGFNDTRGVTSAMRRFAPPDEQRDPTAAASDEDDDEIDNGGASSGGTDAATEAEATESDYALLAGFAPASWSGVTAIPHARCPRVGTARSPLVALSCEAEWRGLRPDAVALGENAAASVFQESIARAIASAAAATAATGSKPQTHVDPTSTAVAPKTSGHQTPAVMLQNAAGAPTHVAVRAEWRDSRELQSMVVDSLLEALQKFAVAAVRHSSDTAPSQRQDQSGPVVAEAASAQSVPSSAERDPEPSEAPAPASRRSWLSSLVKAAATAVARPSGAAAEVVDTLGALSSLGAAVAQSVASGGPSNGSAFLQLIPRDQRLLTHLGHILDTHALQRATSPTTLRAMRARLALGADRGDTSDVTPPLPSHDPRAAFSCAGIAKSSAGDIRGDLPFGSLLSRFASECSRAVPAEDVEELFALLLDALMELITGVETVANGADHCAILNTGRHLATAATFASSAAANAGAAAASADAGSSRSSPTARGPTDEHAAARARLWYNVLRCEALAEGDSGLAVDYSADPLEQHVQCLAVCAAAIARRTAGGGDPAGNQQGGKKCAPNGDGWDDSWGSEEEATDTTAAAASAPKGIRHVLLADPTHADIIIPPTTQSAPVTFSEQKAFHEKLLLASDTCRDQVSSGGVSDRDAHSAAQSAGVRIDMDRFLWCNTRGNKAGVSSHAASHNRKPAAAGPSIATLGPLPPPTFEPRASIKGAASTVVTLADFLQWFSPKDVRSDASISVEFAAFTEAEKRAFLAEEYSAELRALQRGGPPLGYRWLSKRMRGVTPADSASGGPVSAAAGSLWIRLWEAARPVEHSGSSMDVAEVEAAARVQRLAASVRSEPLQLWYYMLRAHISAAVHQLTMHPAVLAAPKPIRLLLGRRVRAITEALPSGDWPAAVGLVVASERRYNEALAASNDDEDGETEVKEGEEVENDHESIEDATSGRPSPMSSPGEAQPKARDAAKTSGDWGDDEDPFADDAQPLTTESDPMLAAHTSPSRASQPASAPRSCFDPAAPAPANPEEFLADQQARDATLNGLSPVDRLVVRLRALFDPAIEACRRLEEDVCAYIALHDALTRNHPCLPPFVGFDTSPPWPIVAAALTRAFTRGATQSVGVTPHLVALTTCELRLFARWRRHACTSDVLLSVSDDAADTPDAAASVISTALAECASIDSEFLMCCVEAFAGCSVTTDDVARLFGLTNAASLHRSAARKVSPRSKFEFALSPMPSIPWGRPVDIVARHAAGGSPSQATSVITALGRLLSHACPRDADSPHALTSEREHTSEESLNAAQSAEARSAVMSDLDLLLREADAGAWTAASPADVCGGLLGAILSDSRHRVPPRRASVSQGSHLPISAAAARARTTLPLILPATLGRIELVTAAHRPNVVAAPAATFQRIVAHTDLSTQTACVSLVLSAER
jgi:hypothetical protein